MGGLEQLKGLLDDPEKMQALQANPMFNIGMGLLSSRYNKDINPFGAAMGGLAQSGKQSNLMADRKRLEDLRRQLAALIAQQQGGGQPQPQGPPMASAMNPPPRSPFSR